MEKESTGGYHEEDLKTRLSKDRFKSASFQVSSVVDGLARRAAAGGEADTFDVDAHLAVFSAAQNVLDRHMEDTLREVRRSRRLVHQQEAALHGAQSELDEALDRSASALEALDGRMIRIGSLAVRVGNRLVSYDQQVRGAARLRVMLESLLDFMGGFPPSTDAFMDVTKVREKAEVLAYLLSVVRELRLESTATALKTIEQECDSLESLLVRRFEAAFIAGDHATMRESAQVLHTFNGGSSCVQAYLDHLPMFCDEAHLRNDEQLAESQVDGQDEQDIDDSAVRCERIVQFFHSVAASFRDECLFIEQVFPAPETVRKQLIHALFERRIALFVSRTLQLPHRSDGWSEHLLFLRSLSASYENCDEFVRSFRNQSEALTARVLMEPLYDPFLNAYAHIEVACLDQFYDRSIRKLIADYGAEASVLVAEAVLADLERLLVLLHANEEALRRASFLCDEALLPRITSRIYRSLLDALGKQLLMPLLSGCVTELSKLLRYMTSGVVGSLARELTMTSDGTRMLRVIQYCTDLVARVERHFHGLVLKNLPPTMRLSRELVETTRAWVRAAEQRIETALELLLNILRARFAAQLLQWQKKTDYRLQDTALGSIGTRTEACSKTVALAHKFALLCSECLDGANCTRYLDEVGSVLASVLYAHYKKVPVAPGMGPLRLQHDFKSYLECAESFVSNRAVLARFELLVELASIHILSPQQLRMFFEERGLLRIRRSDLLDFLKTRPDFRPSWVEQYHLWPQQHVSSAS